MLNQIRFRNSQPILCELHYGFHSINQLLNKYAEVKHQTKATRSIFCDFCKTFNVISHEILLTVWSWWCEIRCPLIHHITSLYYNIGFLYYMWYSYVYCILTVIIQVHSASTTPNLNTSLVLYCSEFCMLPYDISLGNQLDIRLPVIHACQFQVLYICKNVLFPLGYNYGNLSQRTQDFEKT